MPTLKSINARCSLDDFIAKNTSPVIVDDYSAPVQFRGTNYRVPPGVQFDLTALQGKGFQLAAPDRAPDYANTLSEGVGFAFIVDAKGNKTGYHLGSRRGEAPSSCSYRICDDRFFNDSVRFQRYRRVKMKEWGAENKKREEQGITPLPRPFHL